MHMHSSSVWTDSPTDLEVWMEVQLEETVHLNLVLYDQRNTTSSYLQEEADDRHRAFYCCLPPPPMPQPANRSLCLIQLANGTALSKAGKQALPWELTGEKGWSRYVTEQSLRNRMFSMAILQYDTR